MAKITTVITCTAVHHKHIDWIMRSSAEISQRTKATPKNIDPSLGTLRLVWLNPQGEFKIERYVKKASPRTATGIPRKYDSAELVTFAQLMAAVDGQARISGEVKWAMVR